MTLDVYLISYNNEKIVSFVMQYWSKIQPAHIYVYDNDSTDRTAELLEQYPSVKVIPFHSHDKYDPYEVCRIKNKCWKASCGIADYVFVGSFDEVLYGVMTDVNTYLEQTKNIGVTVFGLLRKNILSYVLPEYDESVLLHEMNETKLYKSSSKYDYDKPVLFKPDALQYFTTSISGEINVGGDIQYHDTMVIQIYHLHDIDVNMTVDRNNDIVNRILFNNEELQSMKKQMKTIANESSYRKFLDHWIGIADTQSYADDEIGTE